MLLTSIGITQNPPEIQLIAYVVVFIGVIILVLKRNK